MIFFYGIMKKWIIYLILVWVTIPCFSIEKQKPKTEPLLNFPLKREKDAAFEGKINKALVQDENKVYFSTSKGDLYCIGHPEQRLKKLYRSRTDFVSPPYISGEYIYIYDRTNHIYCIDKKGSLIWKTGIKEGISSGIQLASGRVLLGTESGKFMSLSIDSGELVWELKVGGSVRSLPLVIKETIVFGCDDNNLYFLDMAGKLKKKIETGGPVRGSLMNKNSLIYFGSQDQYFYCVDLSDEKIKWKVNTGGKVVAHPMIYQNYVLFTSWNNVLFNLNNKNGTILWWNPIPARCVYRIELAGSQVLVSSLSSILTSFDIETGEKIGSCDVEGEIRSNPVWFHEHVLVSVYEREKDQSRILFLISKQKS